MKKYSGYMKNSNQDYYGENYYYPNKFKFGMTIFIAANPTVIIYPMSNKPFFIEFEIYL